MWGLYYIQASQPRVQSHEDAVKISRILYTREREYSARDTGTLLKSHAQNPFLQPLTMGSRGGRVEWNLVT